MNSRVVDEEPSHYSRCLLIRRLEDVGVHIERRRCVGMSEATGDRPYGNTGR
jgi:hypothetical protein